MFKDIDNEPISAALSLDYTLNQVSDLDCKNRDLAAIAIPPRTSTRSSKVSGLSKIAIRESLRASTLDGVLATLFTSITSGALLSNFLVELHASTLQLSLLASLPMLANLLQPIGAYLSERTQSRHIYGQLVFTPARLLWVLLILGIVLVGNQQLDSGQLVHWTLVLVFLSSVLGALGSASWMSWMAALVPRNLRGRYFSIRNIACNLIVVVGLPLVSLVVAWWPGGTIAGYGVILAVGIMAGLVSILCQNFMADVNPQLGEAAVLNTRKPENTSVPSPNLSNLSNSSLGDRNPLVFLGYFGFWTFAVNLSAPFFNIYMLEHLAIDVTWVMFYNSLASGANMLMLIVWGNLSDRTGNRPLLLLVGLLVALSPLCWLLLGMASMPATLWLWLPLLHILSGGTWAAIDLCSNNIQIGIAPEHRQSGFFALAAALAGICGALGTTVGGYLIGVAHYEGATGLFSISALMRLLALLPLLLLHEARSRSLSQTVKLLSQKFAWVSHKTS